MNFENWVTGTYSSSSLSSAVQRHSSHQGLKKFHKALHMADAMLRNETVADIALGKFTGFGSTLLLITSNRVLLVKNTFQAGQVISLDLQALDEAELSYTPLMGYTLSLAGHRLTRIPAPFAQSLRSLMVADLANHWAQAA